MNSLAFSREKQSYPAKFCALEIQSFRTITAGNENFKSGSDKSRKEIYWPLIVRIKLMVAAAGVDIFLIT